MLAKLPALKALINCLHRLPCLASKHVYRIAVHLLSCDDVDLERLLRSIKEARGQIKRCCECFNWSQDADVCPICSCASRDKSVLCVVETWHDLCSIENSGDFRGLYHVLGGAISPLEGICPEHLTIDYLLKRISSKKDLKEVILATNPTPEGEATASLIASKLNDYQDIAISRLASGIPIGGSLEFMDGMTIHKAISGRRPF
ncbi:recombination mediator RecR [Candidatus Dependentiae bacterium]